MYIGIILHLSFNLMQVHMICKGVFIKTMNKFNEIGQYIDELWSNRNTDTVYRQKNNEEKDCNVVVHTHIVSIHFCFSEYSIGLLVNHQVAT